jgi:hypothetical protein
VKLLDDKLRIIFEWRKTFARHQRSAMCTRC